MDERLLTPADVAERCQISAKSVLRAIHRGQLRAYRLGERGAYRLREDRRRRVAGAVDRRAAATAVADPGRVPDRAPGARLPVG